MLFWCIQYRYTSKRIGTCSSKTSRCNFCTRRTGTVVGVQVRFATRIGTAVGVQVRFAIRIGTAVGVQVRFAIRTGTTLGVSVRPELFRY
ncbi:hypothetical protein V6N11_065315 [Hibiscus sabdariffa]|uniref:Uncharacterized protein n=1 Tax=Hibiscus sabdariffa TaxID=183260 RepID=A0ABR2QGL7_9ROSI